VAQQQSGGSRSTWRIRKERVRPDPRNQITSYDSTSITAAYSHYMAFSGFCVSSLTGGPVSLTYTLATLKCPLFSRFLATSLTAQQINLIAHRGKYTVNTSKVLFSYLLSRCHKLMSYRYLRTSSLSEPPLFKLILLRMLQVLAFSHCRSFFSLLSDRTPN